MKIMDITTHLSMRYFLYEIITNQCTYLLKMDFDEENIKISKSGFKNSDLNVDVSPIHFLNLIRKSEASENDEMLREYFVNILTDKYLYEEREENLNKLI